MVHRDDHRRAGDPRALDRGKSDPARTENPTVEPGSTLAVLSAAPTPGGHGGPHR